MSDWSSDVCSSDLSVVFSKIARFDTGGWSYTTFVMSGIFAWAYVSGTAMAATTSVVEGASLADTVWFPRAVLALVPVLANGVGLVISLLVLLVAIPLLGTCPGLSILLLVRSDKRGVGKQGVS